MYYKSSMAPGVFAVRFSFCLLSLCDGMTLHPCQLADILKNEMGVRKTAVAHWVCLAKFASGFNTKALHGPHSDGSDDFGVFQINDKYCRRGTKASCGVNCTELVSDDVIPSAKCALWIHRKEGFSHWKSWKNNCKGRDVRFYVQKCFV